jgi:hypothetical protein
MHRLDVRRPDPRATIRRGAPVALALTGLVLLGAMAVATGATPLAAAPASRYSFASVASLPQPAPGIPGKYQVRDFEINGLNQSGGLLYGADFHSNGFVCQFGPGNCPGAEGEGLWAKKKNGSPDLVLRTNSPDPDGEVLAPAYYGPASLSNSGDAAVSWPLLPVPPTAAPPAPAPVGGQHARLHAGVYRYDAGTGSVSVIAKTGSPAPGGGTFAGASSTTSINSSGSVAFLGITETPYGTFLYQSPTDASPRKFGVGVYLADNRDHIVPIAVPGDLAPEGGAFDMTRNPSVNDNGDVAFDGRLSTGGPSCNNLTCLTRGIYVRWASTGTIEKIAGVGDVAPIPPLGSVVYKDYLYGPFVNNQGQVLFQGGVDDPYYLPAASPTLVTRGLFLADHGQITPIVYPGLAVTTSGGQQFTFWRASFIGYNHTIGNDGTVAFAAQYLDDANGDGVRDSGVFVWRDGTYSLVAKTGDSLPGIGVIREILAPASIVANSQSRPSGGIQLNSRGQVAFHATLEAVVPSPTVLGIGVLLVATPTE